jgi:Ser/Thr protein kinase RdoA (MazF antagonist)
MEDKIMTHDFETICKQFQWKGDFKSIRPYGDGHINDTYLVTVDASGESIPYILQRVNHQIFKATEQLMENIERVTGYLVDYIIEHPIDHYQVLTLVPTRTGQSFYKDADGNYWRSYVFVQKATGHLFAEKSSMLYEAGRAFGLFQYMLKDYPAASLHETIQDFHNTKQRYKNFIASLEEDVNQRAKLCQEEIVFTMEHQDICSLILSEMEKGNIPMRVTHNDTKINNVLLDDVTGVGRCVIDLDTVMPGSVLYDFGDAIRSCGSTLEEDAENLEDMDIDLERFEAYTKGYLEIMKDELSSRELELLPMSAIIMTFECGMRFLTDYLDGDTYFKVHKENHNLIRAKNQYAFVKKMEEKLSHMEAIVKKYSTT